MVELCCCCCRVDTALMEGPGIKWKYNVKLVDGDLVVIFSFSASSLCADLRILFMMHNNVYSSLTVSDPDISPKS